MTSTSHPGPTPESWHERLQSARLLIPDSPEQAVAELEQLMHDAEGHNVALQAKRELERIDGFPCSQSRPAEERRLAMDWASIDALDGRLVPFLTELHETVATLPGLANRVVDTLADWLEDEAGRLEAAQPNQVPDPGRTRPFLRLLRALRELPNFAASLDAEMCRLGNALFAAELEQTRSKVERACQAWDIEQAWEIRTALGETPIVHGDAMTRLEAKIDAADSARSETETTLARQPCEPPHDWPTLRLLRDWIAETSEIVAHHPPPQPWSDQLARALGQTTQQAADFLAQQGDNAASLDDIRLLHAQLNRLGLDQVDHRLGLRPECFEPALTRLETALTQAVAASADPGALAAIAERYEADLWNLPATVRTRVHLWLDQIARLRENWLNMQRGDQFVEPEAMSLALPSMIPAPYQAATTRYRDYLEAIAAAREGLPAAGTGISDHCADATQIAGTILADVPGHAGARALQVWARQRVRTAALGDHLQGWEVEAYLALAGEQQLDPPWSDLGAAAPTLRALAGLVQQSGLGTVEQAARWFTEWTRSVDQLPAVRPPVLDTAVAEEARQRQCQWREALERLLAEEPGPQACRATAGLIAPWLDTCALHPYHRRLERAELLGRARQYLGENDWTRAAAELEQLSLDDPDVRPLWIRLEVGQARDRGVGELAQVLAKSWSEVVVVLPEEAPGILDEALPAAWESGEQAALERLCEVARRACRDATVPKAVADRLGDWLSWLAIEQTLAPATTAGALRQLVAYLHDASPGPGLRRRLAALIKHWQQQDDLVALAWAYQALADIKPPLLPGVRDPALELATQMEQAGAAAAAELAHQAALTRSELARLRQSLASFETQWRDLLDYLDLAQRPVVRPNAPETFTQTLRRLDQLGQVLADVEQLESYDLRVKGVRAKWESTLVLLKGLGELPAAAALLDRAELLSPLLGLGYLESRINETANRCSSAAPEDLDEQDLFAGLASHLRELDGLFTSARQTGQAMWRLLCGELGGQIPTAAGVLDGSEPQTLSSLADLFDELERQEQDFTIAFEVLLAKQPWVAEEHGFSPSRHGDYLQLYPTDRPRSRRVWHLFERFAHSASQTAILRRSIDYLPEWIRDYLEQGAP